MKGFSDFIREQGVVGLAVGFILGGAVSNLVASLVENVIDPLLSLVLGRVALDEKVWTIVDNSNVEGVADVTIGWGALLSVFVNFAVIAAVVYYGVKGLGLDKLDKKKS